MLFILYFQVFICFFTIVFHVFIQHSRWYVLTITIKKSGTMRYALTLFRIMLSYNFILLFIFHLILHFTTYLDATSPTIPIISNSGNATESSPPATITIRINGRNTIFNTNLEIPQAALSPKQNSFPNTPNIQKINNNVNISVSLL